MVNDNESELSSLQQQMNGVIAGEDDDEDDSNHLHHNSNEDDDEQDGSTSLINLPQQIASILANENSTIKTDDDQRVMTTNSPSNHLDYSSARQSSNKLLEDFCDICQKHFCNKYYLRVIHHSQTISLQDNLRFRNINWMSMVFKLIVISNLTNVLIHPKHLHPPLFNLLHHFLM